MADEFTTQPTQTTTESGESSTQTRTAGGQQAADSTTTGAGTQTAQTTEATTETTTKIDTSSPEFKAALTEAIRNKLPQLQRQAKAAVAKELSGEKDGEPTVDQLKTEMTTLKTENMQLRARDQLEEFITDKRNNVQVRNVRGLFKFIRDDLQFDDDGKVTNFKEAIAQAKIEASEFFGAAAVSIDAGNGARQGGGESFNDLIRRAAGR